MYIEIDRSSKTPVYKQIRNEIKRKIIKGELSAEQKLPSIRTLAEAIGVHRNTVAKSYGELESEGLICCIQGVECKVSSDCIEKYNKISSTVNCNKKVNWLSLIKEEYLDMKVAFDDLFQRAKSEDIISMGSGIASPDIYNEKHISEVFASIVNEKKIQDTRVPYKGDKLLRKSIISFLATKGIRTSMSNIQIMPGINQALDFVFSLILSSGDAVIIEEPVSPDVYRLLEFCGAKIHTISFDEKGIDCNALEILVKKIKPKFIFVSAGYQNPTGNSLSFDTRKKIAFISNRYRVPIVELDESSELGFDTERVSPIKLFDVADNIIYIYSFHLTFIPGESLAFIVADKEVIKRISYLISIRVIYVNSITQKLIGKYISCGKYNTALCELREMYKRKRDIVCAELEKMEPLGVKFFKPKGGVYVWCKLPLKIDSKYFVNELYKAGVALLPGYVFFPLQDGGRDCIRICYSFESEERLQKGMDIFRRMIESIVRKGDK